MKFGEFVEKYKKVIIVLIIIIASFLIYRYFWGDGNIVRDLDVTNLRSRLEGLESMLKNNRPNQNVAPIVSGLKNERNQIGPYINQQSTNDNKSTNINQQSIGPYVNQQPKEVHICLDDESQRKIAEEIANKLREINACDCRETCERLNLNTQSNIMGNNVHQDGYNDNIIETFYY